jgi:hypothetical protein
VSERLTLIYKDLNVYLDYQLNLLINLCTIFFDVLVESGTGFEGGEFFSVHYEDTPVTIVNGCFVSHVLPLRFNGVSSQFSMFTGWMYG